jgi:branched-chain amino acid transport system permease protein
MSTIETESDVPAGVAAAPSFKPGRDMIALGVTALLLLTVPLWAHLVGGYTDLATRVLIYGLAAMGLNLLLGFTGGLSFGHAAYFGLGAYGTGLMLDDVTHSTLLAMLVGTVVGGVAALVLSPIAVRRRGIYFSMITIAIGQMFYFIAVRWNSVTGGEDGLTGFSRQPIGPLTLTSNHFYYFVLFFFCVGAFILWTVLNSPLGHTFVAIRENQKRLIFLGIRVERYVAISFAISGLICALAGSLNALLDNFASPDDLRYTLSGNFLIIVVLGGMRNFWGPLVGAAIFVLVQNYVSAVTQNWMTVIGLVFVLSVMFFPLGVLGFFRRRSRA